MVDRKANSPTPTQRRSDSTTEAAPSQSSNSYDQAPTTNYTNNSTAPSLDSTTKSLVRGSSPYKNRPNNSPYHKHTITHTSTSPPHGNTTSSHGIDSSTTQQVESIDPLQVEPSMIPAESPTIPANLNKNNRQTENKNNTPQTNPQRKHYKDTNHTEWIGKPPTSNRKTGQLLITFFNIDGMVKKAQDFGKGKASINNRDLETQAYVQQLQHLQVDMIALIDTRLDHRDASQRNITNKFHSYRNNHNHFATTATTHNRINPTIGEINTITTPEVKGYTVGQPIQDSRNWSRWIGHRLQGPKAYTSPQGIKVHRKIAIIAVYGPCKASPAEDTSTSTRALHIQETSMLGIPAAQRRDDPTMQFLYDLSQQILDLEREGYELILGGDWNIPALKTTGRNAKPRAELLKRIMRGGVMRDAHEATNTNYTQPTNNIALCTHGDAALRRHTYQHGKTLTCPDHIIASSTLLEHNVLTQCATLLEYHSDSHMHSMHMPLFLTIDLAAAFSVNRTWLTTHRIQREMPATRFSKEGKLSLQNKKQVEACTKALTDNTPELLRATAHNLRHKLTASPLPPHTGFAKHADPSYNPTIASRLNPEDMASFQKCWKQFNRTVLKSISEGCPIPKRKKRYVRSWSVEYITKMNKLSVLGRLRHAYVQGKNHQAVRHVAKRLAAHIKKCKLKHLPTIPQNNQQGLWAYWLIEIDREIKMCRRACHHRNRSAMKKFSKGRGKQVEEKRKAGEIKQGLRFALRKYRIPQTLTEITRTVPDTDDMRVHYTHMLSMQCGHCYHAGCPHCDPDVPRTRNYAELEKVKAKYRGTGEFLEGNVVCRNKDNTYHVNFTQDTGGTKETVINGNKEVKKAVDEHLDEQFGRTSVSWQTAHPQSLTHPITANTLQGRKSRELLHRGTKTMKQAMHDEDHGDPFVINTKDKYIHNVFKSFRFKQTTNADGTKQDVIDHGLYR